MEEAASTSRIFPRRRPAIFEEQPLTSNDQLRKRPKLSVRLVSKRTQTDSVVANAPLCPPTPYEASCTSGLQDYEPAELRMAKTTASDSTSGAEERLRSKYAELEKECVSLRTRNAELEKLVKQQAETIKQLKAQNPRTPSPSVARSTTVRLVNLSQHPLSRPRSDVDRKEAMIATPIRRRSILSKVKS